MGKILTLNVLFFAVNLFLIFLLLLFFHMDCDVGRNRRNNVNVFTLFVLFWNFITIIIIIIYIYYY